MANSFVVYSATANQTLFTVPFPYIDQSDVSVQINSVDMLAPADYTFPNSGSIQLRVGVPAETSVVITRSTSPDSRLVAFNNGAVLTAADLNTATIQNFYRTQEIEDKFDAYTRNGVARYSITGVNPYVSPTDLINAAADAVLQTTLAQALLGAASDIQTNANDILDQTNRVDTLQSTLDSLTSGVPGGIGTYLTNETDNRIAGDTALADTIALIGAVSGSGTTFILDTSTVFVDGTTSLADKLTGLYSAIGANTATIASEATTRASADSAAATTVSALTTVVSGHTASISSQSSSISGLQAQYTLRIDADGNVAGFGLAAGGGTPSQFTVLANKFAVIDPGSPGGTPKVPFIVTGGVVYMQDVVISNAVIENAAITSAKIANLAVDTPQLANNSVNTITSASVSAYNSYTVGQTQGSYTTITSVTLAASTDPRQVVVSLSTKMTNLANAAFPSAHVRARLIKTHNGTTTTLWEGLQQDAAYVGPSTVSAILEGSVSVLDVPANDSYNNVYAIQIFPSGGAQSSYSLTTLVAQEIRK